ncbi:MAG: Hpt domain-containing protein [Candidatus Endonucleobacter sp. (ex Gigantidas childressi)]|nr:Hpt domain-containing protein [Candidatus Endonucleobacter sp. (ex Gigantidas childressi)]
MLDLGYLKQITSHDLAELNYLLEQFITTTKEDISNLKVAIHDNNTSDIKKISHRIKGSAVIVGAYELKDLVSELECCEKIRKESYNVVLFKIQNCFQSITSEIRTS